ncbi:hypothetical protein BLNAU_16169 [Blattamonas nauphoetae]|uniref:Uncharacterized protein n=1 Tax=Blattamonas nauphoetae TaxID=2049346 RepID=A0ABQ9X8M6_9EUKA|nr:hypothetical protein BLNAU_16169 [Blattamonas nauphoetae]
MMNSESCESQREDRRGMNACLTRTLPTPANNEHPGRKRRRRKRKKNSRFGNKSKKGSTNLKGSKEKTTTSSNSQPLKLSGQLTWTLFLVDQTKRRGERAVLKSESLVRKTNPPIETNHNSKKEIGTAEGSEKTTWEISKRMWKHFFGTLSLLRERLYLMWSWSRLVTKLQNDRSKEACRALTATRLAHQQQTILDQVRVGQGRRVFLDGEVPPFSDFGGKTEKKSGTKSEQIQKSKVQQREKANQVRTKNQTGSTS